MGAFRDRPITGSIQVEHTGNMLGGVEEVPVIQRLMSDLLAVDVCDAAGNDRRKFTMDDFLIVAQDLNSASKNRWLPVHFHWKSSSDRYSEKTDDFSAHSGITVKGTSCGEPPRESEPVCC